MIVPLYKKITDDIELKIMKGHFKSGDKLPSEMELMDIYNASKATVRKSLLALVNKRYIYSIPRTGNFVAKPEIYKYLIEFNEIKNVKGKVDNIRIVDFSLKDFDDELSTMINLKKEEKKLFELSRIFACGDKSVAFDYKIFLDVDSDTMDKESLIQLCCEDIITKKMNIYNLEKELIIEVVKCPLEFTDFLNIKEGKSIIKTQQNYYGKHNKIKGCSITYYLIDHVNILALSV